MKFQMKQRFGYVFARSDAAVWETYTILERI